MAMSLIWTVMVGAAILCGLATGNGPAVAKGALDGAAAGVELCLSMLGVLCLWADLVLLPCFFFSFTAFSGAFLVQPIIKEHLLDPQVQAEEGENE